MSSTDAVAESAASIAAAVGFSRWCTRVTATLVAVVGMGFGGAILLGGPERFVTPSYVIARTLAPWWAWGVAAAACGALMAVSVVYRPRRAQTTGLLLGVVYLFFSLSLLRAALQNLEAPFGATWVYASLAVLTVTAGYFAAHSARVWKV